MKKTMIGLALAAMTALPVLAQDTEKKLYFFNWTDYYPVELLAKFEAETGIEVILDGFDSNDTLLAKLQSGGTAYDVIGLARFLWRAFSSLPRPFARRRWGSGSRAMNAG
jgi:spermidine/putrescine transport system substrate-binding protein